MASGSSLSKQSGCQRLLNRYTSCSHHKSNSTIPICDSVASTSSSSAAVPNQHHRHQSRLPGYIIITAYDKQKQQTILFGSPADKAGLQIGDRIVEVNGCSIEGKEHNQIVRLIHQCIKSRVIQLRVRRKHDDANGENSLISPEIAISDAFLVSPDKEQAREITDTLKRSYSGIRIHDMEMLAAKPELESDLQESANVQTKLMNGGNTGDGGADEKISGNMNHSSIEDDNENERLKSYENDLRKRRELDEKRAKEDAFLRDSLRGSKKLQALENHKTTDWKESIMQRNGCIANGTKPDTGYANNAFVVGDTSHDNIGANDEPIPLEKVMQSVNRVAEHLEKSEGREEDSKLLREFFQQEPVRKAIENTANHWNSKDMELKPTTSKTDLSTVDRHSRATVATTRMEGDLKIVKVNKSSDTYLGATVRNEGKKVIVGRVVRGGMAEKSNLLNEGDELIEANGNDLRGKNITEVCDILRSISGELSLVIAPSTKSNENSQAAITNVKHFRALFDYDPEDDLYVPCKELALKFQRGDILHVLNMSDENWWQAYRDGDDPCSSLAGLIPSISFQQQITLYARKLERENQSENKRKDFFGCTKKKNSFKGKWKKGTDELKSVDELVTENDAEILTYEEVTLYLSKTGRKRPLVLCGPEGVGCLELRQRLAESDKDKFASAVPHTTRPRKPSEIDGVHYHFVTKHRFQEDAKAGKFIEYGEYQKFLYGTSLKSIQAVIDRAKICLLTLKAENLKVLRRTAFMPYVVFIAPPSLQQLRRQKEILGQHGVKDEQLKLILSEGKATEQRYGHLFDRIIVNIDLDRSLEELKDVVRSLETEPHWVPAIWPINNTNDISSKYDEKLIH